MFNNSSNNKRTSNLGLYREENISLSTELKRILTYIERLKGLDDQEKNKVLGYFNSFQWLPSGSTNSRQSQLDLFDSLNYEVRKVEDLLKKLIESLEEENKILSQHFSKLKTNSLEVDNEISRLLINYNQTQSSLWSELSRYLPNITEVERKLIGIVEEGLENNVKLFIKKYKELETVIKDEPKPEDILRGFITLILFLYKYLEAQGGQSNAVVEEFLEEVKTEENNKKTNTFKFAQNFFSVSKGTEIASESKNILDKIGSTPYNSLDDEIKREVNEYLSRNLKKLFKGLSKPVRENAESVIKTEKNFSDEEKEYRLLRSKLLEKISNDKRYVLSNGTSISSLDKFSFSLDGFPNQKCSFELFEKNLSDKNLKSEIKVRMLNSIIEKLLTLTRDKIGDKDTAYNRFMEDQVYYGRIRKSDGSSSSSSDNSSSDDIWKDGREFSDSEVISKFSEYGSEIMNQLSFIVALVQDDDKWTGNELDSNSRESFREAYSSIITLLKDLGKNFDKYKSQKGLSDQLANSYLSDIKTIIKAWASISVEKSLIGKLSLQTKNLIENILK